jgi:outer membrane protein TolC
LNLPLNEPLEAMRVENERKQAIIDELRAELEQIRLELEDANEQITALESEEKKTAQPKPNPKRTSVDSWGGPMNNSLSRDSWGSASMTVQS